MKRDGLWSFECLVTVKAKQFKIIFQLTINKIFQRVSTKADLFPFLTFIKLHQNALFAVKPTMNHS